MQAKDTHKGGRTREEILHAAHRLFITHGYNGTSMRQIAREAGVALGGIYNHFPNKEELFLTVLSQKHPFVTLLPLMNRAQGQTIEEFVRDAARRMVAGMGERMDFLNLVFIELVEFKGKHLGLVFELLYPQLLEFSARFSPRSQELRPFPPMVLVRAFVGLFFSYVMTEIMIANRLPKETMEGALEHFIDIFLRGILVETGSSKEGT